MSNIGTFGSQCHSPYLVIPWALSTMTKTWCYPPPPHIPGVKKRFSWRKRPKKARDQHGGEAELVSSAPLGPGFLDPLLLNVSDILGGCQEPEMKFIRENWEGSKGLETIIRINYVRKE